MMRLQLRRRRPHTAAEWFAAHLGGLDARRERQFQAWLAEDPARVEEYLLCDVTWTVSADAARLHPLPARQSRRAPVARWASAGIAVAAAVFACAWFIAPPSQTWETMPGEQRTLLLADGSRVSLNTRTRIEVRYRRGSREVELKTGEAFFEVAKDPSRPFIVHTALGTARAVGTRFDVYLDDGRIAVTTEEGTVLVRRADLSVRVDAGQQAEVVEGIAPISLTPIDVGMALSWRTQRLILDNVSLGSLLHEFSRYSPTTIRAATPAIADRRLSAVLRIGDLDALKATLKGALGLEVEQHGHELVVTTPDARLPTVP